MRQAPHPYDSHLLQQLLFVMLIMPLRRRRLSASRATHLYQAGMPLALLTEWLGHADPETTLIYAHADTEMKRHATSVRRKAQVAYLVTPSCTR